MKTLKSWRLVNPRGHIESASITENDGKFWLSWFSKIANRHDSAVYKTLRGAKQGFSGRCLSPRYHGKSTWKEETITL